VHDIASDIANKACFSTIDLLTSQFTIMIMTV